MEILYVIDNIMTSIVGIIDIHLFCVCLCVFFVGPRY